MAQTSSNPDQIARDAAMIDAFERRRDGGAAADVPAEWQPEVEAWLRLQRRVRAEPLPEVPASVRAVVLGAAAEVAPTYATANQPWWSRWLQPVPLMASLTAVALAVAVGVRLSPGLHGQGGMAAALAPEVAAEGAVVAEVVGSAAAPSGGSSRAGGGVGLAGLVGAHAAAPEPLMAAPAPEPGIATAEAAQVADGRLAGGEAPDRGAGADPRRVRAERMLGATATQPVAAAEGRVGRTIEAVPASLGPVEAETADAATAPGSERKAAIQTAAELRQLVDHAPSSAERLALLRKLVAVARAAGDDATLKWAEAQAAKLSGPKQYKK